MRSISLIPFATRDCLPSCTRGNYWGSNVICLNDFFPHGNIDTHNNLFLSNTCLLIHRRWCSGAYPIKPKLSKRGYLSPVTKAYAVMVARLNHQSLLRRFGLRTIHKKCFRLFVKMTLDSSQTRNSWSGLVRQVFSRLHWHFSASHFLAVEYRILGADCKYQVKPRSLWFFLCFQW